VKAGDLVMYEGKIGTIIRTVGTFYPGFIEVLFGSKRENIHYAYLTFL